MEQRVVGDGVGQVEGRVVRSWAVWGLLLGRWGRLFF